VAFEAKNIMRTSRLILSAICMLAAVPLTGCTKEVQQSSSSMEPTIKRGEVIEIDTGAFSSKGSGRWDVIVFEAPAGFSGQWVSRVVGLPGETVEIKPEGLFIGGKKQSPPAHLNLAAYKPPKGEEQSGSVKRVSFPFVVPSGSYFVLGDNVGNALDSRYWGGLEKSRIVGKVRGK